MITSSKVSDRGLFIFAALFAAGLSWMFWHYLQEYAAYILLLITTLGLALENKALRAKLQAHSQPKEKT